MKNLIRDPPGALDAPVVLLPKAKNLILGDPDAPVGTKRYHREESQAVIVTNKRLIQKTQFLTTPVRISKDRHRWCRLRP